MSLTVYKQQMYVYLGDTSLIVAANKGHTDFVKILLENGADVNLQNKYG